jgi:hypothetical protein
MDDVEMIQNDGIPCNLRRICFLDGGFAELAPK